MYSSATTPTPASTRTALRPPTAVAGRPGPKQVPPPSRPAAPRGAEGRSADARVAAGRSALGLRGPEAAPPAGGRVPLARPVDGRLLRGPHRPGVPTG
ncbi:hypothetical protein AB0O00_34380, partial [Kitasatospora sp. NPDC093558]